MFQKVHKRLNHAKSDDNHHKSCKEELPPILCKAHPIGFCPVFVIILIITAFCAIEQARKSERAEQEACAVHCHNGHFYVAIKAAHAQRDTVAATGETYADVAHKVVRSADCKVFEITCKPCENDDKRDRKYQKEQRCFEKRGKFAAHNRRRSRHKRIGVFFYRTRFRKSGNKHFLRFFGFFANGSVRKEFAEQKFFGLLGH